MVVLVVFAVEHLLIEVLAFYEATVHRLQLLHYNVLLYHDLRHRRHEEQDHHRQHHREIGDALIVPGRAAHFRGAADVDNQDDGDGEDLSSDDKDVVSDFSVPKQSDHVESVAKLEDDHYDAHYLRLLEPHHEGDDYYRSVDEREEDAVFCVPLLAGQLLDEHVVVRVVHLETLPVARYRQPDSDHEDLE